MGDFVAGVDGAHGVDGFSRVAVLFQLLWAFGRQAVVEQADVVGVDGADVGGGSAGGERWFW